MGSHTVILHPYLYNNWTTEKKAASTATCNTQRHFKKNKGNKNLQVSNYRRG